MTIDKLEINTTLNEENQINGLLYGIFGAFWFAVGVWGLDAILLTRAHADYAFLKSLIGTPFGIIIGCFAGWLTARFDRPVLGGLIWLLAGLSWGFIASHIPFEGLSLVIGYLDPAFSGIEIYPFVYSAQMRMILLLILIGVILALAGGLELFFIESATHASNQIGRLLKLLACFAIFLPVGLLADYLINAPLRAPITGLSETIRLARKAKSAGMSLDAKRATGVRVLDILGDYIDRPYKLILGTYDADSLQETTIYIDFSDYWATCSAVEDKTIVCWKSTERYLRKLDCVINGSSFNYCGLKLEPDSAQPDVSVFDPMDRSALSYGFQGMRGATVLILTADDQDHLARCRMQDEGNIFLEGCSVVPVQSTRLMPLPPTATRPAPTATPTQLPGGALIDPQGSAMLVPDQLQQPALQGAPVYTITLRLAANLLSFEGHSEIQVTNNETMTLDSLYFHLLPNGKNSYGDGSLTVSRVDVDGKDIKVDLLSDNTVLKVPFETPLRPDDKAEIDFDFSGEVPKDFGGTATPAGYGIYNYSDGLLSLSGWYPMLAVYDERGWHLEPPSWLGDSVYSDISFYTVNVSAPSDLTIAATGVAVRDDTDGKIRQLRFESGPVREFFLVASDDLQVASTQMDGTKVNSYFRIDEPDAGRKALSIAASSLHLFQSRFGAYPFKELDIIEGPMRNALGVEFPGIVMIGADLYSQPDDPSFEITVAHEVSHQWWYNVVGNDVFREPWLDEALATYSSGLYYEVMNGPLYLRGLEDYWKQGYQKLVDQGKDDLITESLEHFERLNDPSVYGGIVYRKGALFFAALRQEIGDKAFFQALKSYYDKESFRIARASDLLSAFELTSGKDLSSFYTYWLYSK